MHPENDNKADVSVIIPAYQAKSQIERALKSIANQTVLPREVIVVDDGSEDSTFEIAKAMAPRMNSVDLIVLRQENRGAGAARNRALREAISTYVAFLDADDEWMADKIERSLAVLDGTNHVLVGHDFIRVEADGTEHKVECAHRFQQACNPLVGLFRQGFIGTSTVVARLENVRTAGGFDESLATAQDFDLWLKMLAADGTTFSIFPETLTRYHVTGGSITSFIARRLACSLKIARRHAPGLRDLWFRITAVHWEALVAYYSNGQYLQALRSALVLPWQLFAETLALDPPADTVTAVPQWVVLMLWAWVIGGFSAYIYRFQDVVRAAINMLGWL